MSKRLNMTITEFVKDPMCLAHNRQTWMLADLPLLPTSRGGLLLPSSFPQYFQHRYVQTSSDQKVTSSNDADDLCSKINQDAGLLESALGVLNQAALVGVTDKLDHMIEHFVFKFLPQLPRKLFFDHFQTESRTLAPSSSEVAPQSQPEPHSVDPASGRRCWKFRGMAARPHDGTGLSNGVLGTTRARVAHARAMPPRSQGTLGNATRALIARHNTLDVQLFDRASRLQVEQRAAFTDPQRWPSGPLCP